MVADKQKTNKKKTQTKKVASSIGATKKRKSKVNKKPPYRPLKFQSVKRCKIK